MGGFFGASTSVQTGLRAGILPVHTVVDLLSFSSAAKDRILHSW
jgi:hypothetical protein